MSNVGGVQKFEYPGGIGNGNAAEAPAVRLARAESSVCRMVAYTLSSLTNGAGVADGRPIDVYRRAECARVCTRYRNMSALAVCATPISRAFSAVDMSGTLGAPSITMFASRIAT